MRTWKRLRVGRGEGWVDYPSDLPEVWDLYPTFSGDLAFDIGANGGMTASILAERFYEVIACEPAEESFEHLVIDAPFNVRTLQIAISDHDGEVILNEVEITRSLGELVTGDSLSPTWGMKFGERCVPCMTLDALAQEFGYPDFVKIDTEGHEIPILQGAQKVFADPLLQFVIEVHSEPDGKQITEFLTDRGYRFRRVSHEFRPESPYHNVHYWLVSDGNPGI